eukprot:TRINITY_DN2337_c0_g1_i1.p1 TRINITY_DN2337_c0_g1~~TRINITY_DN2337_c0_g1_i1.p1  ORF type:complete len:345 (-),score=123.49 TRINITY_DN2337_c0_g1_i1:59-1093(-)
MNAEAFGVSGGAYFVSRYELLSWLNDLLHLKLSKVEECATGAIVCQVFDALYPGKIPMRKVKYDAKHEYEFEQNWKILSDAFIDLGISRNIPVEKLIKARQQDNLEFLQWVYEFFIRNHNGFPYDAEKRRAVARGGAQFGGANNKAAAGKGVVAARAAAKAKVAARSNAPSAASSLRAPGSSAALSSRTGQPPAPQMVTMEELVAERQKAQELATRLRHFQTVIEDLEKERDLFYEKVAAIDEMCKEGALECETILRSVEDPSVRDAAEWRMDLCGRIQQLIYDEEDQQNKQKSSNSSNNGSDEDGLMMMMDQSKQQEQQQQQEEEFHHPNPFQNDFHPESLRM